MQQATQTSQSYYVHDYSRPRGGNQQQISTSRDGYACPQPSAPVWQVRSFVHPQLEQPRPDFIMGPTSSVGASHRPMPTAASTLQRSDRPSLFQATTNLFRSFTSTNPPREPSLPTLPRLPTPIDRRNSYATTTTTTTTNSLSLNASYQQLDSDDFHLNQLVTRDFSSPSIPSAASGPSFNFTNPLPPVNLAPSPRLRLRGPPPPSRDLQSVLGGDSDSADSDNSGAPSYAMPTRSRRGGLTTTTTVLPSAGSSSTSTPTARRSSRTPQISPSAQRGSSSAKKRKRSEEEDVKPSFLDDNDVFDLVDKEEIPEQFRKEKNWTKLRDFTCIICYEEVTDLTVTFCGHMFCAGCLHSALTVDPARRVCPVCRQKVDKEPPAQSSFGPRAKGYFPLKLKLMSKQEAEKRKRQRLLSQDDSIV
ncbi:hypothetical protein QBC44DRAFT_369321 [Cladorrhinum sp. PSN332]|nr:hypothetical protein QBC44DRAFT_369321 [Cladorrhinum sp. PSN332]